MVHNRQLVEAKGSRVLFQTYPCYGFSIRKDQVSLGLEMIAGYYDSALKFRMVVDFVGKNGES